MGLEERLIQVDKFIWKGFEKVTQYAYRHGGYSKYDLAQVCDTASSVAITGMGVYGVMRGYYHVDQNTKISGIAIGAINVGIGLCKYFWSKVDNRDSEKSEVAELLRTGATRQPSFTFIRPLCFTAMAVLLTNIFVNSVEESRQFYDLSAKEYNALANLSIGCFAAWYYGWGCADYFRSQIMQPPKAKKSVWKHWYETVTKPFQKLAPTPAKVENFTNSLD